MCPSDKPLHFTEAVFVVLLAAYSFCLSQDLEQKLCLQEQDAAVVKSMKSELMRLPRLEHELKRLREENTHLR